ncbi:MAG: family 16 glycosylhydrolase [Bacteroidia bacterium]|nr:family 16 glycosylhydrolase [Bacteroidia bacterium]MDG2042600.1 family 16 glycosylhydrolase [Bacteroidia bacterium]|tara:strand:- start:155 stop:1762 length:1608 start_codon:yes stop_codon:yes gene_type:complete
MKNLNLIIILLITSFSIQAQVDSNTPVNTLPNNNNIGTNWTLDFSDEFNDTNLNSTKWTKQVSTSTREPRPELSINDWWWKAENVWLAGGELVLKVEKHDYNTMYCGSINSDNKYETSYGYFEARIKIADASKGTHTAFWFQGDNMINGTAPDYTANDGAELDIFESAWLGDYTKSVVHIDGYGSNHKANTNQYNTPGIHSGYHTWGFHWTPDFMRIYYDGTLMTTYANSLWIPLVNEYLWLSDGASFGFPSGSTNFTGEPNGTLTHAYVDYIRVWKEPSPSNEPDCNVVHNADFENTSQEDHVWKVSNNDIALEENTYPVISGSQYCRLKGANAGRDIYSDFVVEPGLTYDFSFEGRIQNAHGSSGSFPNNHTSNGSATLKGEILNGTTVLSTISTQSNTNTAVNGTVTIPSGVNVVTVRISKNWNIGYVDNIELMSPSSEDCLTLTIEESTGNMTIKVFPNPTSDIVTITGMEDNYSIQIFDVTGREYQAIHSFDYALDIDISTYPSGIYFITFINKRNNKISNRKIIKNNSW